MLWKLYMFSVFLVVLLLLYPFYAIWLNDEKHFKKGFRLMFFHTKFLAYAGGVMINVKNRHFLKQNQSYVLVANHSSYIDVVLLYQTISNYFVIMGKEELTRVPVFNVFFKKMNITVNRENRISGKKAMDRAGMELEKGSSVAIFPEGIIPKNAPTLSKFKNGAFKLAIEKQTPIVPITFLTNYKRLECTGLFKGEAGPGVSRAIINEPISTVGMTEKDLIPLRDKVFEIINNQIQEYERR